MSTNNEKIAASVVVNKDKDEINDKYNMVVKENWDDESVADEEEDEPDWWKKEDEEQDRRNAAAAVAEAAAYYAANLVDAEAGIGPEDYYDEDAEYSEEDEDEEDYEDELDQYDKKLGRYVAVR